MNRIFYCDGSTLLNGQIGQDSSVLVVKPDKSIFREHIGNFSINYAEMWAIKRAAEFATDEDAIVTDSLLSFIWCTRYFRKTKNNLHIEPLAQEIKKLIEEKNLEIVFKLRESNLAGHEITKNPFYGPNKWERSNRTARINKWKGKHGNEERHNQFRAGTNE